ncbi:MAG: hypothetical protein KKA81_10650 [Bacteroidetes bacterium]|nr:hypothetical protein [Bacteroidota bacterium]
MMRFGSIIIIIAAIVFILAGCGKANKEVTGKRQAKQEAVVKVPDPREEIRKDADKLASALCRLRKAKAELEKYPDNDFLKLKTKNLVKYKNEVSQEMKAKYEGMPEKKVIFTEELEKAKMEHRDCVGG